MNRLALLPLLLLAACNEEQTASTTSTDDGPFEVYTVNYPLQYFAQRIGGELIEVHYPGPADSDPAFWVPDREALQAYQRADLILLNGADYAKWLAMVSLPLSSRVDTSAAFSDRLIEIEGDVVHSHGPGGEHSHAGHASTTWLDPKLATLHARAIERALGKRLPDHAKTFADNFEALRLDLEALDEDFAAAVAQDPQRPLLTSHPVYQYLQRRYALQVESLHWEPGDALDSDALRELQELQATHAANIMLWEGEPLDSSVETLRGLDIESVVLDPCSTPPVDGDFLTVMRGNANRLRVAFAP